MPCSIIITPNGKQHKAKDNSWHCLHFMTKQRSDEYSTLEIEEYTKESGDIRYKAKLPVLLSITSTEDHEVLMDLSDVCRCFLVPYHSYTRRQLYIDGKEVAIPESPRLLNAREYRVKDDSWYTLYIKKDYVEDYERLDPQMQSLENGRNRYTAKLPLLVKSGKRKGEEVLVDIDDVCKYFGVPDYLYERFEVNMSGQVVAHPRKKSQRAMVSKPTGQLPAGAYWIGDLSYVFDDFFKENLADLEGVHATKAGHPFAIYHTAQGDGVFDDNGGDEYGVDVANIGCISIDAIEEPSDLGHMVRFDAPFSCRWIEEGGFICFGDLAIKTDSLSDAEYPEALGQPQESSDRSTVGNTGSQSTDANASYVKLDPYGLMDLILRDEDEADSETQLVMREIASYIELSELLAYSNSSVQDQELAIWMLHVTLHSVLDEFTEFFRGYYGTPDNEIHAMHLEEGSTTLELYAFLEKLDWHRIFALCRRHADVDSVARIFQGWTGLDYAAERARYPVEAWDGTPRWAMEEGRYLASE